MKVKRTHEDILSTVIRVLPWPDDRIAADVTIIQEKRDYETAKPINRVRVNYSNHAVDAATARQWAEAILRACDIAERLEKEGTVVLEGEE